MKIALIVEGPTEEKVFVPKLQEFLRSYPLTQIPILDPVSCNGRLPKGDKLRKLIARLSREADYVIALTDVYPDYRDASDSKNKMRDWAGNLNQFYPHAAQFEFEAWLLPYWPRIQELAKHNQSAPGGNPETVNHNNPPSSRIKEVLRRGNKRFDYVKTRDARRILENADLNVAIQQCSELKSLVNTILSICGGQTIP